MVSVLLSYENKEWRIELRAENNIYNVILVPIYNGTYGRIEKELSYTSQQEKQAKTTYRRWIKKYCKND